MVRQHKRAKGLLLLGEYLGEEAYALPGGAASPIGNWLPWLA
jgi:hypothetical protein